jgi:hypothetical protein
MLIRDLKDQIRFHMVHLTALIIKRLGLVLALGVIWIQIASGADLTRIAILPFRPEEPTLKLKKEGESIADYLQGKLNDFPNVEWVDRENLDQLLSEAELEFTSSNGQGSVELGRLLKADVLLHGQIGPLDIPSQYHGSEQVTLEVIDLTNADVLAYDKIEWKQLGSLDGTRLDQIASAARKLLAKALVKRQRQAHHLTLAPVFFTNSSTSTRLDLWESNSISILQNAADSFPNIKILRFPGTEHARQEQSLALLGLTATDPLAWQKTAQIYLWGSYHEIP